MAAYLTSTLLIARVGGAGPYKELTDDNTSGQGTPDTTVEKLVLEQVDALVDGYARRGGYTTPLIATDSASILFPLLDIANFKLKSRGNREASDDDRLLYEQAMKILEAIGSGAWVFPSGPNTSVVSEFGIDSYDQLFSRETLEVL